MALDGRALPPPAIGRVPDVEAARPWPGDSAGGSSTEGGDMLVQGRAMAMDVPLLWNDEGRMKRELVAWAKAVAYMAIRESMRC
ncbi:uncharacterized protein LOC124678316 [Lolium rigidum]|uniref:uncharacterized protein LOC124678316 n=1 Tax=Lolium rigidum TaxID=89674 RepID=UPI001F5C108C|nr:uncharacterized protein LOC124678316 [Lolium rigidum]